MILYGGRIACDNHLVDLTHISYLLSPLLYSTHLAAGTVQPVFMLLQNYHGKCHNNDLRRPNFDIFISLLLFEQQARLNPFWIYTIYNNHFVLIILH